MMNADAQCQWAEADRRCRKSVVSGGSGYCLQHAPPDAPVHASRSACEYCSTPVQQKQMRKHVIRCPARVQLLELQAQPFYKLNANCAEDPETQPDDTYSDDEWRDLLPKIHALYEYAKQHVSLMPLDSGKSEALQSCTSLEDLSERERHSIQHELMWEQIRKHLNLERIGADLADVKAESQAVPKPTLCVLELGAGKAGLGVALSKKIRGLEESKHLESTEAILVDRGRFKHKADTNARREWGSESGIKRLKMDLRHLWIQGLFTDISENRDYRVLCVTKHLCGGATDLAIIAIAQWLESMKSLSSPVSFEALSLAPCCHGKCTWNSYSNRSFFSNRGISTARDFHKVAYLSSWTNNSFSDKLDGTHPVFSLPAASKQELGRMCKLLLNFGRILKLRELGIEAQFQEYCPTAVTPENVLMIGRCSTSINPK